MEKLEHSSIASGNIKWYSHRGKLLGIYPKEIRAGTWTGMCSLTSMFMETLLTIGKKKGITQMSSNRWTEDFLSGPQVKTALPWKWLCTSMHFPGQGRFHMLQDTAKKHPKNKQNR